MEWARGAPVGYPADGVTVARRRIVPATTARPAFDRSGIRRSEPSSTFKTFNQHSARGL
jgi:hypothetical protein